MKRHVTPGMGRASGDTSSSARQGGCQTRPVHETADDLGRLQDLLDRSHENAGPHLLEIITPERRISAERLIGLLQGVRVLTLATVTADGRPLVSPVDGLFYRGEFWFGSSPASVRFRHLRRRPWVSATFAEGERLAVTVHGRAEVVDLAEPATAGFRAYCLETYGRGWEDWGSEAFYACIRADKMFALEIPGA